MTDKRRPGRAPADTDAHVDGPGSETPTESTGSDGREERRPIDGRSPAQAFPAEASPAEASVDGNDGAPDGDGGELDDAAALERRRGGPALDALIGMGAIVVISDQIGLPLSLNRTLDGDLEGIFAVVACLLAAVALVTRGSRLAAAGFVAVTVAHLLFKSLSLSNHGIWILILGIGLVFVVATSLVRRRPDDQTTVATISVIGVVTLVAYSAAAFSKVNESFLDPVTSCASQFATFWTSRLGLDPTAGALGWIVVVGTALTEVSVAVLAVFRRTRHAAILLGVTFHWLIAFDDYRHFFDFSVLVMLGLTALGGTPLLAELGDALKTDAGRIWAWTVGVIGLGLVLLWAALNLSPSQFNAAYGNGPDYLLRQIWWLVASVPWVALVLRHSVREIRARRCVPRLPLGPAAAVAGLLALVIAAGPYLGYRNQLTFAMYSGLIAENGRSNHLVVREVATVGWPDQIGRITSSDDARLSSYVGTVMPWPEIRFILREIDADSITIEINGEERSGSSRELAGRSFLPPSLELQRFTPLTPDDVACRWQ